MIKRCNDFGAGGVSVAVGELADGLMINLDNVPKKYDGLDGTELAISESQERMAVVVRACDEERFIAEADKENLEAVRVAVVTDKNRLQMNWRGNTICDISRDFLNTNGAEKHSTAYIGKADFSADVFEFKTEGNTYKEKMPYDQTYYDTVSLLGLPSLDSQNIAIHEICSIIENSIGATFYLDHICAFPEHVNMQQHHVLQNVF